MREYPEPSQHEKEQREWTYYGVHYSDWELLALHQGYVLRDSTIIDTHGRKYPLGDAQVTWKPLRQYTSLPTLASAAVGGIAGMGAIVGDEMRKHGSLDRRGFLRSIFVGAPLGAIAGAVGLPYASERLARHSELGRSDAARAMLGLSHPENVKAYFEENVYEVNTATVANESQTIREGTGYTIETRNVHHAHGKDHLYMLRPQDHDRVALSLHTAAGLPSAAGTINIGADLTEYAKAFKGPIADDFTIFGVTESPYTTHTTGRTFKHTHTVPTAIALSIDNRPVALTSASWTHPLAISYADRAELYVDTLPAWLGFASKTGVWSPDFFRHWGVQNGIAQLEYALPLLQEKFIRDGWTEAVPGHPAYGRVLTFADGKVRVTPDEQAWEEFAFAARRNPVDLANKSYIKPGTVIDLEEDTTPAERSGGIINSMSINGLLLNPDGELLSMVTMNQNARVKSPVLIDIVKTAEPNAKYYVGTDEHDGGGIVHLNQPQDM